MLSAVTTIVFSSFFSILSLAMISVSPSQPLMLGQNHQVLTPPLVQHNSSTTPTTLRAITRQLLFFGSSASSSSSTTKDFLQRGHFICVPGSTTLEAFRTASHLVQMIEGMAVTEYQTLCFCASRNCTRARSWALSC